MVCIGMSIYKVVTQRYSIIFPMKLELAKQQCRQDNFVSLDEYTNEAISEKESFAFSCKRCGIKNNLLSIILCKGFNSARS